MSSLRLHRELLLVLALPCFSTGALADTPVAPTPIGQSASATAAQGGPVVRSHGHDIRPVDAATSAASTTTPAGSTTAGTNTGSVK